MKVLLIAQSRSGSTTLAKAISSATGAPALMEPFNLAVDIDYEFNLQKEEIKSKSDIVVKIVDNHFYKLSEFADYKNLTKHFDKVIGLTINDAKDTAKSRQIAELTGEWRYSSKTNKNLYLDSALDNERYKELLHESVRISKEILSFDIFQVTYEGLYDVKNEWTALENYLGFSIYDLVFTE